MSIVLGKVFQLLCNPDCLCDCLDSWFLVFRVVIFIKVNFCGIAVSLSLSLCQCERTFFMSIKLSKVFQLLCNPDCLCDCLDSWGPFLEAPGNYRAVKLF